MPLAIQRITVLPPSLIHHRHIHSKRLLGIQREAAISAIIKP